MNFGERSNKLMIKPLIILGSGGYGRTVADISEQLGYSPIIVLDDADPAHPLSTFSSYIDENTSFIPAFGNNALRMEWINRIGGVRWKSCHAYPFNSLRFSNCYN